MPRGLSRMAAALLLGSAILAGCTLLIPFDELPEEGLDASLPPRPEASASDAPVESDAGMDVGDAGLDAWPGCEGKSSGLYCGNNGLNGYPGSKDDLVTCDGGSIARVLYCDAGVGCVHMPNPKPDQCDECATKADGTYCGRDLRGWAAENDDVRVQCQAGAVASTLICKNTCISNGKSSKCGP